MKRNIFIVFFLMFVIIGCGQQPVSKQEAQAVIEQAVAQAEQIPIDDKIPDAGISTARNFYFVMDGSGSMDDGCSGERKVDAAKRAVRQFMAKVPEDVNLGLYIFDDNGEREVVPLGPKNRSQFLKEVDELSANGGTPLAQAITVATDKLVTQYKKQLGYGEYRLVVVTDGQASDIPNACVYAAKYNIPIYAIGFCIEGDHPLRAYSLSYREANNATDLQKSLEETLAESESFDATDFKVAVVKK